ncbi:MAG: 3-hydroxyacyl-CoA dehydrogenase family protein [Bacteroidota bacterium]
MKVAVITDEQLKDELLAQGLQADVPVEWLTGPQPVEDAAAYIDLLFTPSSERINQLKALLPAMVIVSSVSSTLEDLPAGFIRINGWKSFLKRTLTEAACTDEKIKPGAEKILSCFSKKTEWTADIPGFISARVVSMIINEAYFALEEGVSSKEEIDTAMKLGTNYPYGPFEWGKIIGLSNVHELLLKMAGSNPRYTAAALLQKEATAG